MVDLAAEDPTMNSLLACILFVALASAASAQETARTPLEAVPDVDLNRYMGTWYEIARLPFRFQSQCVGDVTATYTLLEDGNVQVVNRCRKQNGEISEAKGLARRASKDGPNSKLKVRFAPRFLSLLPFVWGDYWIIVLAPDYTYAVIGEPNRKYLWVLSRTPSMDETALQRILEQVRERGYDLTGLLRTTNAAR
jgi:apolipoprotein D and lipocalin family protein